MDGSKSDGRSVKILMDSGSNLSILKDSSKAEELKIISVGCGSNSSLSTETSNKELKILSEEIILLPCSTQDFDVINELAETYLLVRHPQHTSIIKSARQEIMQKSNS